MWNVLYEGVNVMEYKRTDWILVDTTTSTNGTDIIYVRECNDHEHRYALAKVTVRERKDGTT